MLDALKAFGDRLSRWTMRWVPHSLIVALILNLIVFVLALIWGDVGYNPITVIKAWGDGFWVLLRFAMQMCLILLTGYIVAVSPPVDKALAWLARLPNPDKPWQTILLMGLITNILAFINWGLSIVGAAIFVIYLVRHQPKVDFRLLLATAYLGLGCIWHMGLSASAPLMV
ncbi:MAG TPA: short-chain fatty acid transporter, partial [Chloroflexi bacterium]|nr:short-chain fatty acid transporter [Chloroflexota bacterium]